jgi:hypothetical protein
MGAQRRVTVTAALNANTNPNLSLEWYVNGVKQAQTGRTFDFTPTEVGTFAIQAKVGNLSSNTLNVSLALPVFAVESAAFATASQIKIKAPGGAAVTLTGATLAATSKYDLATGEYILDLSSAVVQGTTVTVRLDRAGSQVLNQAVTFDTRTLVLTKLTYGGVTVVAGADGVFEIVRPFDAGATFAKAYVLDLTQTNILSATANTSYTLENTVPTGAAAITNTNQLIGATLTDPSFVVNSTTALGVYTHKATVGPKVVEVQVRVVEAQKEIEIKEDVYEVAGSTFVKDATIYNQVTGAKVKFDVSYGLMPLSVDATGAYVLTKPFATKNPVQAGETNLLKFTVLATNFAAPAFGDNQLTLAISGPNSLTSTVGQLFSGIETENTTNLATNLSKLQALQSVAFNGSFATTGGAAATSILREVEQYVDRGTPAGTYTFTVTAGPLGSTTSKNFVVKVVEPTPTLDFYMDSLQSSVSATGNATTGNAAAVRNHAITKSGDVYTIEKPLVSTAPISLEWFVTLTNWQSFVETDAIKASNDSLKTPATRELFTTASGVKSSAFDTLNATATDNADFVVGIGTEDNIISANVSIR